MSTYSEDDEHEALEAEIAEDEKREHTFSEAAQRLAKVRAKPSSQREDDELEQAVYEASVAWLRYRWGHEGRAPHCPYCEARRWAIEPPVSLVTRGNSLPAMFPVICGECGHTTFVSSVVPGLPLEEDEDELGE